MRQPAWRLLAACPLGLSTALHVAKHTAIALQVHVTEIAIRLDFKLDESYTPNRLSIRAGTSFHDLREIKIVTLNEVTGWVMIPLEPPDHPCAHQLSMARHMRSRWIRWGQAQNSMYKRYGRTR